MKQLCVTGSLHMDVVVRAPHLPALDETVAGTAVDYVFGGKGGNQAVAAARHGAEVYLAGQIGADDFGRRIESVLAGGSVDISQLQRDAGASGMSVAIVDDQGDYGAVIVSEANLRIDPERIEISEATGILLLQNEVPEEVNLSVAKKAKAAGAQIWLNAAPARDLTPAMSQLVDVLIVNRVEAEEYAGKSPAGFDAIGAAQFLSGGRRTVIITLGAEGLVCAMTDGQIMAFQAFEADVVSTHGAGDVFVGALAAQVLGGMEFESALQYAQGAAALHVGAPIDRSAAIGPDAVAALIASQDNL